MALDRGTGMMGTGLNQNLAHGRSWMCCPMAFPARSLPTKTFGLFFLVDTHGSSGGRRCRSQWMLTEAVSLDLELIIQLYIYK